MICGEHTHLWNKKLSTATGYLKTGSTASIRHPLAASPFLKGLGPGDRLTDATKDGSFVVCLVPEILRICPDRQSFVKRLKGGQFGGSLKKNYPLVN